MVSNSNDIVTIKIQSHITNFQTSITCIVTEKITDSIPTVHIRKRSMNIPKNIKLADPQFNVPSTIQILLGVDIFWQLICIGQIKASKGHPTIQKTQLGWVIAGSINNECLLRKYYHALVNNCLLSIHLFDNELKQILTKFWEIEHDVSSQASLTPIERKCEEHFLRTVARNDEDRFIVTLPTIDSGLQRIGESMTVALQRLYRLERRFKYNNQLRVDYTKF